MNKLHPCEIVYNISKSKPNYGVEEGICRITGKKSKGLIFKNWVKATFTDFAYLHPGNIISNEALFTFDEANQELKEKTKREKLQRFRTYSHIIRNNQWFCYTKANKKEIFFDIVNGAEIVSLTDSGQKHIFFKHKIGFWQLDELYIMPDIKQLKLLHKTMQELLGCGFSQVSIKTGTYNINFVNKNGFEIWKKNEDILKKHRGKPMFDFAHWMLFKTDNLIVKKLKGDQK